MLWDFETSSPTPNETTKPHLLILLILSNFSTHSLMTNHLNILAYGDNYLANTTMYNKIIFHAGSHCSSSQSKRHNLSLKDLTFTRAKMSLWWFERKCPLNPQGTGTIRRCGFLIRWDLTEGNMSLWMQTLRSHKCSSHPQCQRLPLMPV